MTWWVAPTAPACGWRSKQNWRAVETAVGGATGVQDVFLVFKGKYRAPLFKFD